MLKHFRNLVDETASKATFLKAFSRGSGAKRLLPSAASSDPSELDDAADVALADEESGGGAAVETDGRQASGNAAILDDTEIDGERRQSCVDLKVSAAGKSTGFVFHAPSNCRTRKSLTQLL